VVHTKADVLLAAATPRRLARGHMDKQRAIEIVREYFPGASETLADWFLWNETGWPSFWQGEPEATLREQLAALRQAMGGEG